MIWKYKEYQVEIIADETSLAGSSDNNFVYDIQYATEHIHEDNEFNTKYGIFVTDINNEVIKNAVVVADGGGISTPHERSVLIDEGHLVFIIGDSVFCFDLPSLEPIWNITNRNTVLCFEIVKVCDGYVIWGELSVFKVNFDGKIEWDFSGRDIFVTPEGKDDFVIQDDLIIVKDWDYNIYKIRLDGKEVK